MKHLTQEQTDALLRDDTEYKFKPWQPVIVRDYDAEAWEPQFFSHYANNSELPYRCMGTGYRQCLPAKGNRHLIGTTDSPTPLEQESEFKFGDKVEVSDNNKGFYEAIFICKSVHYGHPYFAISRGSLNPTCFKFCRHADW